MKNKLFYSLIILIFLSSLGLIISQRINDNSNGKTSSIKNNISKLEIGNKTISVEIAQTEAERTKGLSGRKNLSPDSGMLFIFDKPDFYQFWMKDMNFPLDIVWLDKNYQVVDLTENLLPSSYPATVTSLKLAQFVLEMASGSIEGLQIKVGDRLKLK